MAISAADLTYPTGELQTAPYAEWFPGEVLADSLAVWIAQGYSAAASRGVTVEADADGVAEAFAYAKGYRAVSGRLAGSPSSVGLEDMSQSVGKDRHEFFTSAAVRWEAVLLARLAAGVEAPETVPRVPLSSRAMPNSFVF
jgi:hypothetical protein